MSSKAAFANWSLDMASESGVRVVIVISVLFSWAIFIVRL